MKIKEGHYEVTELANFNDVVKSWFDSDTDSRVPDFKLEEGSKVYIQCIMDFRSPGSYRTKISHGSVYAHTLGNILEPGKSKTKFKEISL